jgi:phospholipid N-methyltransferase
MQYLSFVKAFLNDRDTVGSIWPSSPLLVQEMVKKINERANEENHILEVGAGTGVITKEILSLLKEKDTLDIVEIHPEFAKELRFMILNAQKTNQVTVYETGIERFQSTKKYTHIISSLPLTNFNTTLVIDIYKQFKRLLKEGGVLTYFEYQGLKARLFYSKIFFQKTHYKRLSGIKKVKENFLKKRPFKMRSIFSNLPPARVYHVNHLLKSK